ncbi:MAG TPA: Gfo/Idh/MocA family oxidoreductase [Casimicrobiaceae bacterium]|nr:Gfo/Idh/MocA family oxidoreductase [Casimicrobiaceae bacterium]
MERLRIAVAGAGVIGCRHIEEIAKCDATRLAAIVDPSPTADDVARANGVPRFASLDDLMQRARLDGVIVATPNAFHVEQALACLAAGVPTLVEKPVSHTYADGVRLCMAVERSGAKLLVGHHRRHSPILRKAVSIVKSGELGPIVAVMGSAVFYKPDTGYFDGVNAWRRQPGGGPILINMIHEVDNLRAIVGEIVAVQAMASSRTRGFEVEDTVAINLQFDNGALGTFLLSDTAASPKSWEQTSGENEAYARCDDDDAYAIIGATGSLGVPTMRVRRYGSAQARSWFEPFQVRVEPVERQDPLANQIAHFAQVIRGEAEPLVTCRDGLANVRVTEAIAEAARTQRRVDLA